MIKLRITHGYQPTMPLIAKIYQVYLGWLDTKDDSFKTQLIKAGRIPVVSHITLQMHTDAIEGSPISMPGKGNEGKPTNPGDPAVVTTKPPNCLTIGCGVVTPPGDIPCY